MNLICCPGGKSGSYVIPDSVTSIGVYAFCDCTGLTSITIPDSVTSIGNFAFDSCTGLTSVTIGNGVTSIGSYAFSDTAYYNDSSNWEDGVLYIDNCLIKANSHIPADYEIKSATRVIGDYAFYVCSGLTSITIPDSVTSIGGSAFSGCTGLTSITIPDSVTSIGSYAFERCSGLTSVTIPDSVTSIGRYAFYGCSSLADVYYGGSEEEWNSIDIGDYNDELLNADIHYSSSPATQPTPTPIPLTTAEIERTDTAANMTYSFDIDAADKYESCYVYAAVYDDSGVLLAVSRVPLDTSENTSVSVNKSENDALVKVFIWAGTQQSIIETASEFTPAN